MAEALVSGGVFRFGEFEADLRARELRRGGALVALQDQPFHLLAALLEHPGELVTRDDLRVLLWSNDTFVDFDHGLNTAIRKLRDALADSAQTPRFIETLPKRGYRFLGSVERIPTRDAATPRSPSPAASFAPSVPPAVAPNLIVGARRLLGPLLLAGTAGFTILLFANPAGRHERSGRSAGSIRSLAVLPLEDLAGDPRQPSFADAMTEALTTDLGRTAGLRVISRRSANFFRSSVKPAPDIGRELKVEGLVEGSVQRAENRIRIDLRMVHAPTGEQVWAGRFEGPVRDSFVLEDEAAHAVRAALALSSVKDRAQGAPRANPEAFDLYLRGKIRVRSENENDNSAAISLLERAVALDPEFAPAQAELSFAYGLRVAQFDPGDTATLERAELAAQKALRLNTDLAEAHYAAGHLLWGVVPGRFAHERALQELKRAVALNPNLAEAHHYLGMVYLHIGLLEQAVLEFQKTLSLEPTDSNALRRIALVHIYRGQYEEALRMLRQVPPQSNPSLWHYDLAWTLQYVGKSEEAWTLMEEYLRVHPDDRGGVVTSTRAIWFAKAGDVGKAEADIRTALEKGKGFVHFHHTAYNVASAYAVLGRPGPAVQWLRVAAETGYPCYPHFASDPNLRQIWDSPAYIALMSELKVEWERYRTIF
jgi:TolB-like protein/DNA-binding winged helix-turn-helix (wHTH) protein/Flp pilus assembly protein TadD